MTRNITLDLFRLLLIILVITIHIQPLFSDYNLYGWLISNGIARIVVPFFFIVSGYYLCRHLDNTHRLKSYLLHLLIIYLVWTLIYLPTYIYELAPRSLLSIIFFGYYHLWFIPALIWGIIILFTLKKIIKNDAAIFVIAILVYVAGYILTSMYYDYKIVRNGFFIGFPLITIGYYIQKRNSVDRLKNPFLIVILALSVITLLLESYTSFQAHLYRDAFLSVTILCPALFILILKNTPSRAKSDYFGRLASGVYFVHIFVIMEFMPTDDIYYIYKYPLVILISIIFSVVVVFLNKYVKILL